MKKIPAMLLFALVAILLLVQSLPAAANEAILLSPERLLALSPEQQVTGNRLELTVITDQEQIGKELERIGIDYDKAIAELERSPRGPGGHYGPMWCPGPASANDLFFTTLGPYLVSFFEVGGSAIDLCVGGGYCEAATCLVNAACPIPAGVTAIAYAVTAPATVDLGWGCG